MHVTARLFGMDRVGKLIASKNMLLFYGDKCPLLNSHYAPFQVDGIDYADIDQYIDVSRLYGVYIYIIFYLICSGKMHQ